MTKAELLKEFEMLQEEKAVKIDGIYWNSRKILEYGGNGNGKNKY